MLTALLRTLDLRDRMTARHSAAVARYAREIAIAAGFSKEEQDLVHTAGLLHDIGKFIFPDRILKGDTKLTDEDWKIIKMHPYQGARVVAQMEGYGPVSEIILAHHERIDGKGYPRGLKGDDIPALSRIISVADTYDVMTARDSYRKPISSFEAIQELRRVAGAQLDAEFVEMFIKILAGKDVRFRHGEDADFDAELGLDKRVAEYSLPLDEPPRRRPTADERPTPAEATPAAARPQLAVSGVADSSCGDPLRGHDVDAQSRAELEAGEPRQARHHVDVPVEVLGAARGGAHPEVHAAAARRGGRLSFSRPSCSSRCAGLGRRRSSARGGAARAAARTGERDAKGASRTASSSTATTRSRRRTSSWSRSHSRQPPIVRVLCAVKRSRSRAISGRHEVERVELRVGVLERGARGAALVHHHVHVGGIGVRRASAPASRRRRARTALRRAP